MGNEKIEDRLKIREKRKNCFEIEHMAKYLTITPIFFIVFIYKFTASKSGDLHFMKNYYM